VKDTETSTPGTPPKTDGALSLQNRPSLVRKGSFLSRSGSPDSSGCYFLFIRAHEPFRNPSSASSCALVRLRETIFGSDPCKFPPSRQSVSHTVSA
jgi:hypothetical protein